MLFSTCRCHLSELCILQEKTKTRTKWDVWEVPAGPEKKAKYENGMDLSYFADKALCPISYQWISLHSLKIKLVVEVTLDNNYY